MRSLANYLMVLLYFEDLDCPFIKHLIIFVSMHSYVYRENKCLA